MITKENLSDFINYIGTKSIINLINKHMKRRVAPFHLSEVEEEIDFMCKTLLYYMDHPSCGKRTKAGRFTKGAKEIHEEMKHNVLRIQELRKELEKLKK